MRTQHTCRKISFFSFILSPALRVRAFLSYVSHCVLAFSFLQIWPHKGSRVQTCRGFIWFCPFCVENAAICFYLIPSFPFSLRRRAHTLCTPGTRQVSKKRCDCIWLVVSHSHAFLPFTWVNRRKYWSSIRKKKRKEKTEYELIILD